MTTQRSPGLFRRLAHGSLVKTNLVGLVLGDSSGMDLKTRGGSCWSVRYFVRRRTESRCPPSLVLMLVMASIANHQHGQKTNIRPIFVPLSAGHLLCCSGRSNLQFCLPFYPALVQ